MRLNNRNKNLKIISLCKLTVNCWVKDSAVYSEVAVLLGIGSHFSVIT